MRSFHLLSFVSSIFLLSCSPSQAQQLYRHEKPRTRHRHVKRDANAVFTYFNDGQGACGITNGPNDFIVALNAAQYDGGAHCFNMITITVNGKMAQAQITDECSGCSDGGLDFSPSLFEYFAPLSEGQLYGSWTYNSDIVTSSSTPPAPTTSYTPTWTPTTTVATGTTSSSSSKASPTTIMTSSASTILSSSTSTTTTVPTSTPQDLQTIAQIELALVELGTLLQVSFELST